MLRRSWTFVALAVAALAAPAWLRAQPRPQPGGAGGGSGSGSGGEPGGYEITINDLQTHLQPIAVPAMRGDPAAADVTQIVSNDLRLSALFRVLDPATFHADLAAEGLNITPPPWIQAGASSVIKAQVTGSGDRVTVDLRVWEPGHPASAVLSRTFGPGNLRTVSHQIANEVIRQYTGRPGVFGTRLAFARRTGRARKDVFTVDVDGANLTQVSPGRRLNFLPGWGPGGVYFTLQTREGFLQLVREGRPEPTPVLAIEGMAMGASFAGQRLVTVLTRDGNPEVYSATSTGQDLRRLTNNPAADISPVFSPDGSRVAFVSDRDGTPQIYVMAADGSNQRRLTFQGTYNQTPAWSPDGGTVAYASRVGGNFDIFTINVASGAVRRLTENQGSNSDPTYSPDGRLIAFSSSRGGIFLMNADGQLQQQILAGGGETLRWEPLPSP